MKVVDRNPENIRSSLVNLDGIAKKKPPRAGTIPEQTGQGPFDAANPTHGNRKG